MSKNASVTTALNDLAKAKIALEELKKRMKTICFCKTKYRVTTKTLSDSTKQATKTQ
jgi:hypothetical protein